MLRRLLSLFAAPGEEHLAGQYREMHAHGRFKGQTWRDYIDMLRQAIPEIDNLTIVDFGCGPHGGLLQAFPENTRAYDPFVERYSTPPWQDHFDVFFSADVFEHIPLRQLDEILQQVSNAAPAYVFLNVSTRLAYKNLPDGTNAHITVKSPEWWLSYLQSKLGVRYTLAFAKADLIRRDVTLCFKRSE